MVSKKVMRDLMVVLLTGFCGTVSSVANAAINYNFDGLPVAIDYWAGSGSNEAVVVVDFGATGGDSYAFGFEWNGIATRYDALVAIAAAGPLEFEATDYGSMGYYIDNFQYNGESGNQSYYWQYFTSSDGSVWDSSMVGPSDRILTNGDFDGWYNSFNPGVSPTTPIPEPLTIVLLGVGGLFLRKRRA
ncbi:MAG: PEP-CTERM sorting domain-containing protein [Sedimentisphaerales bacterium]